MIKLTLSPMLIAMIANGVPCELVSDDGEHRIGVIFESDPDYVLSISCSATKEARKRWGEPALANLLARVSEKNRRAIIIADDVPLLDEFSKTVWDEAISRGFINPPVEDVTDDGWHWLVPRWENGREKT